jgi:hypothetical protein
MNEVAYGEQDNHSLVLRYKGTSLAAIESGPGLTEELIAELERAARDEEESSEIKIARAFLYARAPTEAAYRYRDRFQIVPVPPDARRPKVFVDDWPFVLEFAIQPSTNLLVEVARTSRIRQALCLLLLALLRFRVSWPTRFQGNRHWVIVNHFGSTERPTLEQAAQGYFAPDFDPDPTSFSDLKLFPPIDYEAAETHVKHWWIEATDRLCLPSNFETLCDTYFALSDEPRSRFLRAAFWLSHADQVRAMSVSAAFSSLVQAVECLAEDVPANPCPECGRDRAPGPTAQFADTMERYGAGLDRASRNTMYQARSRILHGDRLLHSDFMPDSFTIQAGQMEEEGLFNGGRLATQVVLVGWLDAQSRLQ